MSGMRPRPTLSPRLQRAMGLKAAAYTALSAGCFPIAGMVADPGLRPMLAAFGLAFTLAAFLAITIYRKGLTYQQATPAVKSRLAAATVAVVCLGVGQLVFIVPAVLGMLG